MFDPIDTTRPTLQQLRVALLCSLSAQVVGYPVSLLFEYLNLVRGSTTDYVLYAVLTICVFVGLTAPLLGAMGMIVYIRRTTKSEGEKVGLHVLLLSGGAILSVFWWYKICWSWFVLGDTF
jgi:hypothetical protein